jgi:hypothetical protein
MCRISLSDWFSCLYYHMSLCFVTHSVYSATIFKATAIDSHAFTTPCHCVWLHILYTRLNHFKTTAIDSHACTTICHYVWLHTLYTRLNHFKATDKTANVMLLSLSITSHPPPTTTHPTTSQFDILITFPTFPHPTKWPNPIKQIKLWIYTRSKSSTRIHTSNAKTFDFRGQNKRAENFFQTPSLGPKSTDINSNTFRPHYAVLFSRTSNKLLLACIMARQLVSKATRKWLKFNWETCSFLRLHLCIIVAHINNT